MKNLHGVRLPDITIYAPLYSGKSTVADYLVREYGYVRLAFADEVKHLTAEVMSVVNERAGRPPITIEDVQRDKAVFRPMLQWLGTDYVREYLALPNYWADALIDRYCMIDAPVVVDDMRFPNEAVALKQLGFTFVRVDAPENRRFDNFLAKTTHPVELVAAKWEEANSHESESHYGTIDHIVTEAPSQFYRLNNDDDFDTLFNRIEDMMLTLTYGEGH